MKQKPPPNPQTIGSLHGYGHTFAGLCSTCTPVRDVVISMPALIARRGPDFLVRHAIWKSHISKMKLIIESAMAQDSANPTSPIAGPAQGESRRGR